MLFDRMAYRDIFWKEKSTEQDQEAWQAKNQLDKQYQSMAGNELRSMYKSSTEQLNSVEDSGGQHVQQDIPT